MLHLSGRTVLAAVLGASLVLNLVLGGLMLWRPGPANRGARGFDRMVGRIEAALPEADRPRFREVLATEKHRYVEPLTSMRAASAEVDAVMRRTPYEPEALRAALHEWSTRMTAFNAAFGDTLADALGAVSAEGRAKVAAARRPGG